MLDKNNLLSIGDIAKLTGATIKALRYYDRIKLLEPAFIDPNTKYRYYTFDQAYFVSIIMFCVELDIPLKELTKFIDESKIIDMSALIAYGKEIAERKLKKLQQGLQLIANVEQKIALSKQYQDKQMYSRGIREKYFYVVPVFDNTSSFEAIFKIIEMFSSSGYTDDDYDDTPEYGSLLEYSPDGVKWYAFFEIPSYKEGENIKKIPAGEYLCKQNQTSQIENTSKIFNEYLKGKTSYLAIETELLISKYEINKPINELRIIGF